MILKRDQMTIPDAIFPIIKRKDIKKIDENRCVLFLKPLSPPLCCDWIIAQARDANAEVES